MNDANAPLSNAPLSNAPLNLDFPDVIRPDALQRHGHKMPTDVDAANSADALISLVQELNQQNHDLLNQITVLEGQLTARHQNAAAEINHQPGVSAWSDRPEWEQPSPNLSAEIGENNRGKESSPPTEALSQEQVLNLLNQLEFAQQANQRQDIRVESLSTQLLSSQEQIEQLEAENDDLQRRCTDQSCRLNRFEEECRDLRLRLQRQQQYTLQFKAALEKCLEVPPPSYGFLHVPPDTLSSFDAYADTPMDTGSIHLDPQDAEVNCLVQPLFPKVRQIQPWPVGLQQEAALASESSGDELFYEAQQSASSPLDGWDRSLVEKGKSVAVHFPESRFQSTLRTLAHKVQVEEQADEGKAEGGQTEAIQAEACLSENELASRLTRPNVPHNPHRLEDEAPAVDQSQYQQGQYQQGQYQQGVTDRPAEPSVSQAIAPLFEPSLDHLSPASPQDDKLWQSLVNLIDMSAADGLNIKSTSDPKQDGAPQNRASGAVAKPSGQSHSGAPPSAPQNQASGAVAKPSSRQTIDLPSFLAATHPINPSPA